MDIIMEGERVRGRGIETLRDHAKKREEEIDR